MPERQEVVPADDEEVREIATKLIERWSCLLERLGNDWTKAE